MRILFLGDIVGSVGRDAVAAALPTLREAHTPDLIIANGENAAAGLGITPSIADDLFALGVDAITLGNHAFHRSEISTYLDSGKPIVRPANFPPGTPGRGMVLVEKGTVAVAVLNLCGRTFMDRPYDDPFRCADALLEDADAVVRIVDFHAEATSEKMAMAWHLDGRVAAVLGTHTHVQTADARILPGGTAFLSDMGMCGPRDSVIGMDTDIILRRMKTLMPLRLEVAKGPGIVCGVLLVVDEELGGATEVQPFCLEVEAPEAE